MGCGAVCGAQQPTPLYLSSSKHALTRFLPTLMPCQPFLSPLTHTIFTQILRNHPQQLVLPLPSQLQGQSIQATILQKWKNLLYGSDKMDQIYKKCLSFEVRDEKHNVTAQNNHSRTQLTQAIGQNKSYHQLAAVTQYHECFVQIQKDLGRTFDFKQDNKIKFQLILKRISNYFPSMGYTQGVNFVVGYLLLLGYSQSDTFWIFIHLALNKRYMLLGLYQQGFPLAYLYTLIFKNMLRRLDARLYTHIYDTLMLDQSIWIFKWFITYYVYSFPIPVLKYIWNMVIQLGGIGIVYFALALALQLKSSLLGIDDPCDFDMFWKNLKNTQEFNKMVKMGDIMNKVYQMSVENVDLQGIQQSRNSFYQQYMMSLLQGGNNIGELLSCREKPKNMKTVDEKLHLWWAKLAQQRLQFQQQQPSLRSVSRKQIVPDQLKSQYLDMAKSLKQLQQKVIQNDQLQQSRRCSIQSNHCNIKPDDFFASLSSAQVQDHLEQSEPQTHQLQDQDYLQPVVKKTITIIKQLSYDMNAEIDQEENQSDSNNDTPRMKNSQELEAKYNNRPNGQPLKFNTYLGGDIQPSKQMKPYVPKISNIPISIDDKRSGFGLAGQNILCNISVTNSHYSSQSSKPPSLKPKRQKQNNIFRHQRSSKARTQQGSFVSNDPSSQKDSLPGSSNVEKESVSGYSHCQGMCQVGEERKTQQDLMTSSHGPQQAENRVIGPQLTSQVQLFNGGNLFKKKRSYNRNNINTDKDRPNTLRLSGVSKLSRIRQEGQDDNKMGASSVRNRQYRLEDPIDQLLCEIQSIK